MGASDKTGYLYAIHLENAKTARGVKTGFFGRARHAGGSSQFISPVITAEVLWPSTDEAYKMARRARCCPDGTTYQFYEFAYVMTMVNDKVEGTWTGKTKIQTDRRGQFIVKSGGVFRPQRSKGAHSWLVSSLGYQGTDVADVRVKVKGGKRQYQRKYWSATFGQRYHRFSNHSYKDRAAAEAAFAKWLAKIDMSKSSSIDDTVTVVYNDGTEQTWFYHGDTVLLDPVPKVTGEWRIDSAWLDIQRPKKLKKARRTTECWRP